MRLNKEIRESIVENAYTASDIPAAKKSLTARSVALAEKIRLASMPKGLDDSLKAAEAEIKLILKKRGIPEDQVPSKIFSRSSYIGVYFGASGGCQWVHFNGGIEHRRAYVVTPDHSAMSNKFKGADGARYDDAHEFTIEYHAIRDDAIALRDREKIVRATVKSTVDKFNTVEKLVEMWPEASALIPKHIEKANAPMPIAIQVADLNAMIGLPK